MNAKKPYGFNHCSKVVRTDFVHPSHSLTAHSKPPSPEVPMQQRRLKPGCALEHCHGCLFSSCSPLCGWVLERKKGTLATLCFGFEGHTHVLRCARFHDHSISCTALFKCIPRYSLCTSCVHSMPALESHTEISQLPFAFLFSCTSMSLNVLKIHSIK